MQFIYICIYFYHIILGEIDSPDLLARVNFHVSARIVRNFRLLRVDQTRRAYSDNEPLTDG